MHKNQYFLNRINRNLFKLEINLNQSQLRLFSLKILPSCRRYCNSQNKKIQSLFVGLNITLEGFFNNNRNLSGSVAILNTIATSIRFSIVKGLKN